MPYIVTRVTPTDYDAWHEAHSAQFENLKQAGVRFEVLCRDTDDPETVVIIQEVEDLERPLALYQSPEVQELVAKAPIVAPPSFHLLEVIETPIGGAASAARDTTGSA